MRAVILAILILISLENICATVRADGIAYAKAVSERLGVDADGVDVDGRAAFVLLPKSDGQQTPQPWILYAPALPAFPDAHEGWMHQRFTEAGVAVAGVDVGEAYGSPRGTEGIAALYRELVENRGFATKPCLLARSRGGLWLTSWAAEHPEKVAGVAGIYPVFDLRSYPGLEKAAPAYGITAEELHQQLPQRNPINKAAILAKANIPMMVIHGLEDKLVPFEANSAEFAARYTRSGDAQLITLCAVEGQGHNYWDGFFQSPELVEFAIARARAGAAERE